MNNNFLKISSYSITKQLKITFETTLLPVPKTTSSLEIFHLAMLQRKVLLTSLGPWHSPPFARPYQFSRSGLCHQLSFCAQTWTVVPQRPLPGPLLSSFLSSPVKYTCNTIARRLLVKQKLIMPLLTWVPSTILLAFITKAKLSKCDTQVLLQSSPYSSLQAYLPISSQCTLNTTKT